MSKAEPDPLSGTLTISTLKCNTIVESLKWNNCEFDLTLYIAEISDLFAKHILCKLHRNFEYSLLLIDNKEMKEFNSKYRNKNESTNVLSFPQFELPRFVNLSELEVALAKAIESVYKADIIEQAEQVVSREISNTVHLGDIAMSFGTFQDELISLGLMAQEHFAHLLIHSLLHLVGYDHISDLDAENMMRKEIQLLEELNISNPYK